LRRGLVLLLGALVLSACGSGEPASDITGAGSLPLDARSPLEPPGERMRVLVQLRRPPLAEQIASTPWSAGRQRAYVTNVENEVAALQSSLRAKDVKLGSPVTFARVWNGFAATIRARDLPRLQASGLRAEPVRRFYGAALSTATTAEELPPAGGDDEVALLDTGVDLEVLGDRVVAGRDAVDHDSDPSAEGDAERHGTEIAGVLGTALGEGGPRIRAHRVAGLRRDPETGGTVEYGTTDELLEGLERAVDPNGDGDTTDHASIALVGVNSPYAGFDDSPEAEAVEGASAAGTLVVAPAGNEGPRVGRVGTIGSPAAAPGTLAVAALEGGGAPALPSVRFGLATEEGRMTADAALIGGATDAARAEVTGLTGPSQENPKATGRALGATPLEYFGVEAEPRARGHAVVVPASEGDEPGPALATRASAAAEAGAAMLVVCEPDLARPLPALPNGAAGIPVIGLRGDDARRALDLTTEDGGLAFVSDPSHTTADGKLAPGRSSSQGPTYALAPKPDLAAPGTARVREEFVAGTSVAAARVAAAAAKLRADEPAADPPEVAARLTSTATARGPLLAAGAGEPDPTAAAVVPVVIEPGIVGLPRQDAGEPFSARATVTVRNSGGEDASLTPTAELPGARVSLSPARLEVPAGETRELEITATATGEGRPPGHLTGELSAGAGRAILALPVGPPPPAPLDALSVSERDGKPTGVRFTAGAVRRAEGGLEVQPLGDLTLEIVDADGEVVRGLTPPGGARNLLPGEYAYTLTKDARAAIAEGSHRFRATAHGPAGGPAVVRTSPELGDE
jgi:hypothetical protein